MSNKYYLLTYLRTIKVGGSQVPELKNNNIYILN